MLCGNFIPIRGQCEELRSTMSKRRQDEVAAERMDQLRIKAQMEQDHVEEEQMYAQLWYQDMMSKAQREEEETKRQMSANQDCLDVLNKQMAALEAKKEEEKTLKEEEAVLLVRKLLRSLSFFNLNSLTLTIFLVRTCQFLSPTYSSPLSKTKGFWGPILPGVPTGRTM